jgi:hypothetical protein
MEALFYLLANYILLSSNKGREKFIDRKKEDQYMDISFLYSIIISIKRTEKEETSL